MGGGYRGWQKKKLVCVYTPGYRINHRLMRYTTVLVYSHYHIMTHDKALVSPRCTAGCNGRFTDVIMLLNYLQLTITDLTLLSCSLTYFIIPFTRALQRNRSWLPSQLLRQIC